jgi:hypothetical protein
VFLNVHVFTACNILPGLKRLQLYRNYRLCKDFYPPFPAFVRRLSPLIGLFWKKQTAAKAVAGLNRSGANHAEPEKPEKARKNSG